MSWSYSGNPASSPLDEVRFLIGDTNPDSQQLSDEEINYNITIVSGPSPPATGNFLAAAYSAGMIAATYARSVDKSVGDLSISYGNRYKQFQTLSNSLKQRATFAGVPVYVGGISIADKETNKNDADLIQPGVRVDGMNLLPSRGEDSEIP